MSNSFTPILFLFAYNASEVAQLTPHPLCHLQQSFQTNTDAHTHFFFFFSEREFRLRRGASRLSVLPYTNVLIKVRRRHASSSRILITYLSAALRLITVVIIDDSGFFFFFIEFVCTFTFLLNTH